jgi:hypothetical protein
MTWKQIPYGRKQGIFSAEQGIFSREQGIGANEQRIVDGIALYALITCHFDKAPSTRGSRLR